MKKILKNLVTAAALLGLGAAAGMPVSGSQFWNHDIRMYAAYGTPEIDGRVGANEWDAAPVIEMRLHNCPMFARGFVHYQTGWAAGGQRNSNDYSGNHRIMWDSDYIYFLEERRDTTVNLSGSAADPQTTDGVIAFTQVDSPNGSLNPEGISVHILWTAGNGRGAIGGDVMARIANMSEGTREVVPIPGARVASSRVPGGFVVEVAVPWSFYKEFTPDFVPGAGTIMGLSFLVHDANGNVPAHRRQFLFARDSSLAAQTPGGSDFGGWGTLELLGDPAAPAAAPLPEAAAPVELAVSVEAAPPETLQVSVSAAPPIDAAPGFPNAAFIAAAALISAAVLAAGAVIFKKRKAAA